MANAGSVDADLLFAIGDDEERGVRLAGVVDDFPAFEIYASFDDRAAVTILQAMPRPGMAPFNLLGPALNEVRGYTPFNPDVDATAPSARLFRSSTIRRG